MRFIICTAPPGAALAILQKLLDERLVACGNIIPGLRSLYRWEGQLQDEPEELILMESSDERFRAAMERIAALHPYSVPKIVSLEADAAHDAYATWVREMTTPES